MPDNQYDKEAAYVQTVLKTVVTPLARSSGFVQRRSLLSAERFVQMVVLACLSEAEASLTDMVAVGDELGVEVSVPGLDQRIDDEAVVLLQGVLQAAVAQAGCGTAADCPLFAPFTAVHLQDSTYLALPAPLAAAWRGAGGNASPAGAKVWLSYEYRSGTIVGLEVGEGCRADQACTLAQAVARPGSLHLFDLGFFSQDHWAALAAAGSYFVCRHQYQTALYTLTGERIDLERRLAECPDVRMELTLRLGARAQLPVRLLCQRVPQEVADRRRANAKAVAKRRGRTLAATTLRLLDWNLFCTNVPAAWWNLTQVLAVYHLRWQVELLFKLAKSQAGLDCIGNWRPARVLAQLYARLIALVLAQHCLAPLRFAGRRELSLPKAFRLLQRSLPQLIAAIAQGGQGLAQVLATFGRRCLRLALKDARRKDPSTFDWLLALEV